MFESLSERLEAAHALLVEAGKAAIVPAVLEFLAKYPSINAIRFQSGVPGYNDGDPCEWTLRDIGVELVADAAPSSDVDGDDSQDEDDEDRDDEDDEDFSDREFLDSYELPDDFPECDRFRKDLDSLHAIVELAEDGYCDLFGVDVEVIIGRDGKAHVSEWDIGY